MRFNFHNEAFFDNHTHLLLTEKTSVTADEFIDNYYHGGDDRKPMAMEHLPYQGVILTLINQMAGYLGCEATLDAVVAKRNELTATPEKLAEYTRKMYADENIIGTTLDCEHPFGDPRCDCFPCEVFRLYQFEKPLFKLIASEETYDAFLEKLMGTIRQAVKDGFQGLKGHLAERYSMAIYDVDKETARKQFPKAHAGDKEAEKEIYFAAFSEVLLLLAELDVPMHLHTGSSGFGKFSGVDTMNPVLMNTYLKNHKFDQSKIVFLHAGYPFVRQTAMMAFNFPNVYMDLAQTIPWQGMAAKSFFIDALSLCPHDKLMVGSGQHFYSETAWLAAKTAKNALAGAMEDLVNYGFLNEDQALKSARMILSENALRLYHR